MVTTEDKAEVLPEVTGGELVPVEKAGGPQYEDVVRELPFGAPEAPPSMDASLYRIANVMEASLQDARHHRHYIEAQAEEMAGSIRLMSYLFGVSLVVQGLLLFVAAFH